MARVILYYVFFEINIKTKRCMVRESGSESETILDTRYYIRILDTRNYLLFTTSVRGIGIFVLGRNKKLFVTLRRSVPKQIKYKQHTERVQRKFLEFTAYRLGSSRSLTNRNYNPIMFLLNLRFLRSKSIVADLLFLLKIINSFIHCPRLAALLKYALMRSSTFTRTFLPHRIAIYPR